MRFQAPQLGALGVTFTAFRAMQFVSLVAIVGMTSNFINDIVTSNRDMPDVLVGTLSVVCSELEIGIWQALRNENGSNRFIDDALIAAEPHSLLSDKRAATAVWRTSEPRHDKITA